jgi:small subunit ribosomal protein S6
VSTQTERVTSLITGGGGEIVEVNPWGGKRRLAYPIQRHRDGYYVTTKFRSSPDTAYGLEAQLNINDNILRHLVIRLDPRKK